MTEASSAGRQCRVCKIAISDT